MLTRPSFITEPGTFAPKLSEMPSSGWMWMTRRFVSRFFTVVLNDDLGGALREPLPGAEIEGNAGPAPVVDLKFQSDEGFGVGFRRDIRLAAILRHRLAV